MTANLLLIEDDEGLGYVLKTYLELREFHVEWVRDGVAAERALRDHRPDLCVLDVMLPRKDGFELAASWRAAGETVPIVFLTARSLKVDQLKAYKLGADDYLTKPVDEEVLVARIQAVLRRCQGAEPAAEAGLVLGGFTFFPERRLLVFQDREARLTERENQLLTLLCRYRGRLLSRDLALETLWGGRDYFKRKSMDVHLSKLRKILRADPRLRIVNLPGRGFILKIEA